MARRVILASIALAGLTAACISPIEDYHGYTADEVLPEQIKVGEDTRSSVLAQQAAIAGLGIKSKWFPEVQRIQRANQQAIKEASSAVPGLSTPIYPSQGNFLAVDCHNAEISPDALVASMNSCMVVAPLEV